MKQYPLYIDGRFVTTDSFEEVVNPSDGLPFATISTVGRDGLSRAIEGAHAAFPGWRDQTAKARGTLLHRIAAEIENRREEIATTMTRENGKPYAHCLGEIAMSIDHLEWYAEEARRAYGRVVPNQVDGKRHLVIKMPMGVIGAISPWNFPLLLAVRKMAPALAAGNTVVLKPANQTPLTAVALAECIAAANLPAGVFQLIVGPPAELAAEMLQNPLCRKISFTGSTRVGRLLIAGAADTIKPLSLELGGQAPVLIFEDADLKTAVDGAMMAKFRNTGQSCIAANRIYVQRAIYDDFLAAFTAKAAALRVGDGMEAGVEIGPLINQAAIDKALVHVENAIDGGARILCGGKRLKRDGFFLAPTVLADLSAGALCMTEETFAPIAPVTVFDHEEEGIELANGSIYGLSAYAFTTDLSRTFRLMERLDAGTIAINDGVPTTSQCPFGGTKQSGWGRELGSEGMDAFLETRHVSLGI